MTSHLVPRPASLALLAAALAATASAGILAAQDQPPQAPQSAGVKPAPPSPAADPTPAGHGTKDIALDAAPASAAAGSAQRRLPGFHTPLHDAATAGALGELGLDLLRQQSANSGNAQRNAVVSPLSLAAALGMVHAGTSGAGARELATLLGSASAGERSYRSRLPLLLDQLAAAESGGPAGTTRPAAPARFTMANRVWLDKLVAPAVPATYAALVTERFNADAAVLAFARPDQARQSINGWAARATAGRIAELMPAGAVSANTRIVVTSAIHFKSPWARKFDPVATMPKPFQLQGGAPKMVPTMIDERQVLAGVVDGITVYELPFAGERHALVIGMPPAGRSLNAFETDLAGLDIAAWSGRLQATNCQLELPRFNIAPVSRSLKPALQALGVQVAFTSQADFAPMLGKASAGVHLDDVFQSAGVTIDESGGEAVAASGASMAYKGLNMQQTPRCAVDRPFIFAVVHKPSGAPLFVGKMADPGQP